MTYQHDTNQITSIADGLDQNVQIYPQTSEDEPGGYRSELDELMADAASILRSQHARIAELESMLDAVGAGGVGQSIKPQVQADTVIQVSVPTGWKLVPVEPTDDMFIEGMEADCRGRPSIDDDNHVRSIWRAMLSSAPDAPRPPAQSCCTCTKTADLHKARRYLEQMREEGVIIKAGQGYTLAQQA